MIAVCSYVEGLYAFVLRAENLVFEQILRGQ